MEERKSKLFLWWGIVIGINGGFLGGWMFGLCYYSYFKLGLGWLAILILMIGIFVGFFALGLVFKASEKVPPISEKYDEDGEVSEEKGE